MKKLFTFAILSLLFGLMIAVQSCKHEKKNETIEIRYVNAGEDTFKLPANEIFVNSEIIVTGSREVLYISSIDTITKAMHIRNLGSNLGDVIVAPNKKYEQHSVYYPQKDTLSYDSIQ